MNPWFIVVMLAGASLPIFAPSENRKVARRIFWTGVMVAGVGGFLVGYPPNWPTGLALSGLAVGMMLLRAYFNSPYLKFRGKIYAFSVADSQPDPAPGKPATRGRGVDPAPDSYGGLVTAQKSWWLLVPVVAMCSVLIGGYLFGGSRPATWLSVTMAGVLILVAVSRGHEDASWGYPIARGQRLQFGIVTVITAGVFAALYLPAYYAGKRRPWRPKRSMEYRAHPRHHQAE